MARQASEAKEREAALSREIDRLAEKKAALEDEVAKLQKELEDSTQRERRQIDDLNAEHNTALRELQSRLIDRITALEVENAKLFPLQAEMDALKRQMQNDAHAAKEAQEALESDNKSLKHEIARLEAEMERLKKQTESEILDIHSADDEALQALKRMKDEEIGRLYDDIKILKRNHEDAIQQLNATWQKQKAHLKDECKQTMDETEERLRREMKEEMAKKMAEIQRIQVREQPVFAHNYHAPRLKYS